MTGRLTTGTDYLQGELGIARLPRVHATGAIFGVQDLDSRRLRPHLREEHYFPDVPLT